MFSLLKDDPRIHSDSVGVKVNFQTFAPFIRVVGSNHDEEFTVEELKEMAAKGCPLSRMKLKELEEDGVIEPDYEQLESMASQGCPMAKAKLAKLAGKIF